MRVSVVSDVHGNFEDLARVADQAEFLIVLGDLIEYIDYHSPSAGIMGGVFGAEAVQTLAGLRLAGRFDEFHAHERDLWSTVADPGATLEELVCEQYRTVANLLSPNALVTLGNVDVPAFWDAVAPDHHRHRDGEMVEVDELRFGFIAGGALKHPVVGTPWSYFERTPAAYRSSLENVGPVDVLCSHVPPDISDLRHDVQSGCDEMCGPGLLEAIDRFGPALALFGHVHHPRSHLVERGETRCVNVGFFKRGGQPFVFDTDQIRR